MFRWSLIVCVVAALLVGACGGSPNSPTPTPTPTPDPTPTPPPPPPPIPAKLSISRILAFGDSMTEGTVTPTLKVFTLDAGKRESYPFKLQTLLTTRYSDQTLSVFNGGIAGKHTWEDRSRLASN